MSNQLDIYTNERDELLRKRALAERKLTSDNSLTAQQRETLLRYIQAVDSKLDNPFRHPIEMDVPSTGLNVLSFLFPLVGLILFLVFMDSKPTRAHAIGKWALIGFCVSVGISVLSYVFFFTTLGLLLL